MESVLPVVADRLFVAAIAGTGQPAAAAGGGGGPAGVEAIRQPEERGAAAAGQRAVRGMGGGLVRRAASGAAADRAGQLLSSRSGRRPPFPGSGSQFPRCLQASAERK